MVIKETHYEVRAKGTDVTVQQSHYSKFATRLKRALKNRLQGSVYGRAQAIEHARECRKIFPDETFHIVRVVTTRTIVKIIKPNSNTTKAKR